MNKNNKLAYLAEANKPSNQQGVALLGFVLVLIVIISLISITASKTAILETKMVSNMQDKQRSLLSADSATLFAWKQIKQNINIEDIVDNNNHPGLYVLGQKIATTSKSADDWNEINDVSSWPWNDSQKRFSLPEQLGGSTNPMQLARSPQYTVGMHDSVLRKGMSDYRCIPVKIIGAGQGGSSQTRSLIEIKVLPKSTCYREKIK